MQGKQGRRKCTYAVKTLTQAVIAADLAKAKELLESDARSGIGPDMSLHYACAIGDVAQINLLLKYDADCNALDVRGHSPLYYASMYGQCEVLEILLNAGAGPNMADSHGRTPLHYASMYGQCEVLEILLNAGADPNMADSHERTPLYYAWKTDADVFARIITTLCDAGGDINRRSRGCGLTALHDAIIDYHCPQCVEVLLEHGADIHAQTTHGNTALHFASRYDRIDTVRVLLAASANPTTRNAVGKTPANMAKSGEMRAIFASLTRVKRAAP